MFLEAGRYSDISELALPSTVASLKYIDIDCGTPEMLLNSSTNFTGRTLIVTRDRNKSDLVIISFVEINNSQIQ